MTLNHSGVISLHKNAITYSNCDVVGDFLHILSCAHTLWWQYMASDSLIWQDTSCLVHTQNSSERLPKLLSTNTDIVPLQGRQCWWVSWSFARSSSNSSIALLIIVCRWSFWLCYLQVILWKLTVSGLAMVQSFRLMILFSEKFLVHRGNTFLFPGLTPSEVIRSRTLTKTLAHG